MIEDAIEKIITQVEFVKNSIQDRYYANETPDEPEFPLLIYSYSEKPIKVGNKSNKLKNGTLNLFFWGNKFTARTLDQEVRTLLSGYKGIVENIKIKSITDDGFTDGYDNTLKLYFYNSIYKLIYMED